MRSVAIVNFLDYKSLFSSTSQSILPTDGLGSYAKSSISFDALKVYIPTISVTEGGIGRGVSKIPVHCWDGK